MRALLLLPQAPLEGRDRPVGDLPGLGSRPDNFWRDRVRVADRPGAKKHHLKKSPLPTLPTPPNLPTIPPLPTLPTLPKLTWLALPALACPGRRGECLPRCRRPRGSPGVRERRHRLRGPRARFGTRPSPPSAARRRSSQRARHHSANCGGSISPISPAAFRSFFVLRGRPFPLPSLSSIRPSLSPP